MRNRPPFDTLHEECGVFGIYGDLETPPAQAVYYGLYALQHRGQESCGIAVSDQGVLNVHRAMGLVSEVFNEDVLASLPGQAAIGHVRYSTAGGSFVQNCQPLLMRYVKGRLAIAHNGNLTNAETVREELAGGGAIFQTTIDSEVIAHVIAQERIAAGSVEQAVVRMMGRIRGAYSLLVMSPQKLVAARDPFGFRPLVIGSLGSSYVIASETCALDAVNAEFIRDVEPGEVVVVDADGLRSIRTHCAEQPRRMCVFEYIYFARPDSTLDGVRVHAARLRAGALLAQEHPVEADIVIGVPDSGLDAAIGYAQESGIRYETGFVRNNYVGRTFIKPEQGEREASINIKLNVLRQSVAGKRIVMVDDSIVRGSTSANIIRALKNAGAKEVHVRISSPTLHWPCYFGTDIPTREELTSNRHTVDELCRAIGADSLGFLSYESLYALVGTEEHTFCDACFTGEYPIPLDEINGNFLSKQPAGRIAKNTKHAAGHSSSLNTPVLGKEGIE